MLHRQTPLQHHRVLVAVAQGISQVPPDTQEDDVGLEMTPCLLGCKVFMNGVGWARDSRYNCYFYQIATSFCNTTPNIASGGKVAITLVD